MRRKCENCQSASPGSGEFCQFCGRSAIVCVEEEEGKPGRGSSVRVVSADDVEEMAPLVQTKAPIFSCIGGYGTGTVVSISAPPGAGKTTEALRVAVAQDAKVLHLIAGEMSDEQARAAAEDAGASAKFFRDKKHQIVTADEWGEALDYTERACSGRNPPAFVIWDSTSMWVPSREEDERDFIEQNVRLASDYDLVVFAICQWSQQGRGRGTLTIPHGGALWIEITNSPMLFKVRKARPPWSGKQGEYPRPRLKPGQTWEGMEVPARRRK